MADISVNWADDLVVDATGDIALASDLVEIQQRLIRRFLTNSAQNAPYTNAPLPPDYIFDTGYGGNARRYVDALRNDETAGSIQSSFLNQAAQEDQVARSPRPVVNVKTLTNGFAIDAVVAQQDGTVVLLPQIEITT